MNALHLVLFLRLSGVKIAAKGMLGNSRDVLVSGNSGTFFKRPLPETLRFRHHGSLDRISSQKSGTLVPSCEIRALAVVLELSVSDLSTLWCLGERYPEAPTRY